MYIIWVPRDIFDIYELVTVYDAFMCFKQVFQTIGFENVILYFFVIIITVSVCMCIIVYV